MMVDGRWSMVDGRWSMAAPSSLTLTLALFVVSLRSSGKAAELKDAASKMVEARYARETTTRVAVEGGTERGVGRGGEAEVEAAAKGESTATRLSRKRSRGDLSVEEKEALEERIEEQLAKNTVVVDE